MEAKYIGKFPRRHNRAGEPGREMCQQLDLLGLQKILQEGVWLPIGGGGVTRGELY